MTSFEIFKVRFWIDDVTTCEVRRLGRGQLHGDFARDFFSELALQAEDVLELPVVPIGPECFVRPCRDELDAQPYAPVDQMRGTLENGVHVQLARNFWERQRGALVPHGRGPRDDAQRSDASKV